MAAFGTLTLLIALVVATYAGVASLIGARRGNRRLILSGRAGVYALAGGAGPVVGRAGVRVRDPRLLDQVRPALLGRQRRRCSTRSPRTGAASTARCCSGSSCWRSSRPSPCTPTATVTASSCPTSSPCSWRSLDFFLYLIVFEKNPFDTFLTDIPTAGKGLNPLLQNPYMVTHPPSLYAGFVGMTIPYAFAMAALISGQLDDAWLASVRAGRSAPGSSSRWA